MAFWGCVLKPGGTAKVENPEGDILHLSQACLHDPKDGKNYIQAQVQGVSYSIACLEKGKKEHDSFDLFFNPEECSFKNAGKSEVHLTGYFEPDDNMDDEDEEEEEKAKEPVVAAKVASPKVAPKESPKAAPVEKASPKAAPKESPKASPKQAAAAAKAPADEEEDDDEEGEEEEVEEGEEEELLEDEEEEESGDEEPAAPPAKKAKKEEKKAAAPAKGAPAASGDEATYVNQLVEYLKKNGKTQIGMLGSKVAKPKTIMMKLKAFIDKNTDKFTLQGDSVVAK